MKATFATCDPRIEEVAAALDLGPAAIRHEMSTVCRDGHECVNHHEIEQFAERHRIVCACGTLLGFRGRSHSCPMGRDKHGG